VISLFGGERRVGADSATVDRPMLPDDTTDEQSPAVLGGGVRRAEAAGSCRLCPVSCERLVYPSGCVESGCDRLYTYDRDGHQVMGCLDKVFRVEIDVDGFRAMQRSHVGFGPLRVWREPNPVCRCAVERTFEHRPHRDCENPDFRNAAPATRV
jgi:hypothetical protein